MTRSPALSLTSNALRMSFLDEFPIRSLKTTNQRWLFLFFCCLLTVGKYYCYNNPQALESSIEATLGLSETSYNILYSVYAFPNIVTPIVGGVLINRIGTNYSIILFALVAVLGQAVFCLGAYLENFLIMVIGRALFGLHGECMCVVQSILICKWFKEKELGLAIAMGTFTSCIAMSLNSFITPKVYIASSNLWAPLLVGDFVCLGVVLSGMVVIYLDTKEEKLQHVVEENERTDSEKQELQDEEIEDTHFRLKDLLTFRTSYWVLLVTGIFYDSSLFSYLTVANQFYQQRFGFTQSTAGNILTMFYLASGFLTPVFGKIVDDYGQRITLVVVSLMMLIGSMVLLSVLPQSSSPYFLSFLPVVMLGLLSAMFFAGYYTTFPMLVAPEKLAAAYGVCFAANNLGLTIVPLVVGVIHDGSLQHNDGYFWVPIYLGAMGIVAITVIVIWLASDFKAALSLNRKVSKRSLKFSRKAEGYMVLLNSR